MSSTSQHKSAFIGTTTEDIDDKRWRILIYRRGNKKGAAGDNIVILTGDYFANATALQAATTTGMVDYGHR